jgi:hypothetical protein
MSEIGCDFALWGDPSRPFPVNGEYDVEDSEHALPISEDLRTRILAWADRYRRYDDGERDLDVSDFDGRGMYLSRHCRASSVRRTRFTTTSPSPGAARSGSP